MITLEKFRSREFLNSTQVLGCSVGFVRINGDRINGL